MRFLPDGRVEITNKKTGEVRAVTKEELPNYGIKYGTIQSEQNAYKELNAPNYPIISGSQGFGNGFDESLMETDPEQVVRTRTQTTQPTPEAPSPSYTKDLICCGYLLFL